MNQIQKKMKYNDENVSRFLNENRVIRRDEVDKCKDLIRKYLEWEQSLPTASATTN